MKGRRPRCGKALRTPPPVSRMPARSSEMIICGAVAAAEVGLDLSGEVMDVHDGALDARLGEPVQRMIDERAPGKPQERFRNAVGQRTHARAKSRRQHHRGVNRAAIRCFHIGSNLVGRPMLLMGGSCRRS